MESVFNIPKKTIYLVAGFFINLCLGSVYSWSIFRRPLENALGIDSLHSGLPFMLFLMCYAFSMPFAGFIIEKVPIRIVTLIGAVLVGSGWFLSGNAETITQLSLTYGVIGGTGVGILYGVPLLVTGKWFPNRKGLAIGLTLAGFGLSPFISAPTAEYFIEAVGVLTAFKVMGIIFFIVISALSFFMALPEENPDVETVNTSMSFADIVNLIKSKEFYSLWILFFIGTASGLSAISLTGTIAVDSLKTSNHKAALLISLFAVFNAAGRPLFGYLTDKLEMRHLTRIAFSIIATGAALTFFVKDGTYALFIISFSMLWMLLGGWLAIAPAAVMKIFGKHKYSRVYGLIFTAYGFGALTGTMLTSFVRDVSGSDKFVFIPVVILSLLAIRLTFRFFSNKNSSIQI